MSSLRCLLFGLFRRQSNFGKQFTATVNRFAFIHNSKTTFGGHKIEIKMPSLSPTMTEGTIVKWLKKEGDTITPGDVICEIQTDKAVVGLEVEEEGMISKIIVPESTQNVKLGEIIAVIIGEGDEDSSSGDDEASLPSQPQSVSSEVKIAPIGKHDSFRLGPAAKKLLAEYDIKQRDLSGSGPHNNLLKGDILHYIRDKNLKHAVKVPDSKPLPAKPKPKVIETKTHLDIPITSPMQNAAKFLVYSKNAIPHAYINSDCTIDKMYEYKRNMKQDGYEVRLNDFLIRSVAYALRHVPRMNAMYSDGKVTLLNTVNVSITINDGNRYIMPVVKDADKLTVQLISEQVQAVSQNTKEWTLDSENFQGGAFRIFSLDSSGISEFSAIIYPPEVAILAIGGVRCVPSEYGLENKIKATLSFNSEIVSDDVAGLFMSYFKECLENPLTASLN